MTHPETLPDQQALHLAADLDRYRAVAVTDGPTTTIIGLSIDIDALVDALPAPCFEQIPGQLELDLVFAPVAESVVPCVAA